MSSYDFYNKRGKAEQWIKEGKYALNWTRPSAHRFAANQVRRALFVLAYNLGNLLRRPAKADLSTRGALNCAIPNLNMAHYVFRVLNNPFSVTTARNLRPKARESIRFGLNFPFYEGT